MIKIRRYTGLIKFFGKFMSKKICKKIMNRNKPNDVIYTPKEVALLMIDKCNIKEKDKVLDPCLGGGVFYDNFPPCNKQWCEIEKGKDYFDFNDKVDLVIGNPPYSIWNKWLEHTIKITNKICFILGVMNLTPPRLQLLKDNGFGITYFHILKVDWWFSPSFIVIWEKDKNSVIDFTGDRFTCDICNSGKRCNRGRTVKGKKCGMNECINI